MTVTELAALDTEGFVYAHPGDPAAPTRHALARAAYDAISQGDRAAFRAARAQLRLVTGTEGEAFVLSQSDADEFNSLVNLGELPSAIDWNNVYDDPDL